MSVDISNDQKTELVKLLTAISRQCDLDALGIVTREGIPLAFFANVGSDPDLLSAISAAITSTGETVTSRMDHGDLHDMIITGTAGFTIMATAGEYILIGATTELHSVGLTLRTIRDSVPHLRAILTNAIF